MDIDRTPSKTVAQRLARYGLQDREKQLADLHVMPDTTMHLTVDQPDHRHKMAVLPVKTAEQLKHWLGVPNGVTAQTEPAPNVNGKFVSRAGCYPFVPHPATPLKSSALNADLMSYLLRDTSTVPPEELRPLNNYISKAGINFVAYLFRDIYIDRGATLVMDTKVQTLFAGYIYINRASGKLVMQSPVASIDCFGIEGVITIKLTATGFKPERVS